MTILINGYFTLHAGGESDFKIDCDSLTDADINEIAKFVGRRIIFSKVLGVPKGGSRLANALKQYEEGPKYPLLLVDDVWTTGKAMNSIKKRLKGDVIGFVIFARTKPEDWVRALFYVGDFANTQPNRPSLLSEAWPIGEKS